MVVKVEVRTMVTYEMEEQVADEDEQDQRHDERCPCLDRKGRMKGRILQDAFAQRRFRRRIEECNVELGRIDGGRRRSDDDSWQRRLLSHLRKR